MIILDTDVAIDILHTFNQKHYEVMVNLKTVQPYRKG